VKKAFLPSELANFSEVKATVESFGWQEKIDSLRRQIERTRSYSATKEEKDKKIQRRHFLKMQLDYLEGKLRRFTMTEVPDGFSNRQGVDIGIIGRYARLYMQTVFRKVSTVKGATTSEFRKMWGLQDYYAKKERVNHSHHCIDAITIACIGRNEYDKWAQYVRDEENHRFYSSPRPRFPKPWETFTEDVKAISDTILVPHSTPSNLSKHTRKRLKVNGKLRYGADGEQLYVQGDTARCSLHEQTFYGSIRKNDEIRYVVRKSLDALEPKDVDKIVDDAVREKVKAVIAEKGFKKAMSEDVWMNEELKIPIKKVRIYTPTVTNPIKLKGHRDKSVHEHKRYLYVKNDGNYCMAVYEGNNDKGKVIRSYKLVNNLDAVNYFNGKTGLANLVPFSDEKDLPLKCILKTGTMVLFYEKSPRELCECGVEELSKRLYKVIKMFKDGRLAFKYHLEARNDDKLKADYRNEFNEEPPKSLTNGYSYVDFTIPFPKLLLSKDNFNMLVEGYHFNITTSGRIAFKNVSW
jgi:CRISPR-associated endonuclease Csn1